MQVAANRMTREDVMAQANTRNDEEPDAASRKVEIRPEGSAMLDATDESILDALEEDGRATLAQLSRLSGLSVSAVQSRVQKLEKRGVIKVVRVSSPSKLEELLNRIHRTVPVSTESTVILQTYF